MPYQDDDSYIADYDNDFGGDFDDCVDGEDYNYEPGYDPADDFDDWPVTDDELLYLTEGEDFEEDADDYHGFQNPVFGEDFTDSDTPPTSEEDIDKLLNKMGL